MKVLLRLGWRDLSRNRRFTLLFVLNLALGLAGVLLVTSFGTSLARHFDGHLREMLTADLVLQSSRPLSDRETALVRNLAGAGAAFSRQVSFYTMVRGQAASRLAQIIAIDGSFPLYGSFRYDDDRDHGQVADSLQQRPALLLSPETARFFGLGQGGRLAIGQAEFAVAHLFQRDPDSEFATLSLAPKIYLGLAQLEPTGLIRFGSRVTYRTFVRLADSTGGPQVAERLNRALRGASGNGLDIRVVTTLEVNRRLGRVAGYFSSFLSLAALVSLLLAGLNGAYLFREHLRSGRREIAILLSLGAGHLRCLLLFVGELLVLGLLGAAAAIGLARLLLPVFGRLFLGLIPSGLNLDLDPVGALMTLALGTVGSLLFCLPLYQRILGVRPLHLFGDQGLEWGGGEGLGPGRRLLRLAALLPALALVLALSVQVSHSLKLGAWFVAGLAILLLLFSLLAQGLSRVCRRWSRTGGLTRRLILRNLYRNRLPAAAVFVTMATTLLLVNLVPQVEKGLVAEISQPEGLAMPELFLIDIQEEQQQPLRAFFRGGEALLSPLAPMVPGRIVRVNATPFSQWQEQVGGIERIVRRTEFYFSTREQLDVSESVVRGEPMPQAAWSPESGQPFAISMEQEFSQRLGVGIGDRLLVDIQGIEMEGRIINLRRVRWNSFQPNFFMLVQAGVIEGAPKTFLASVSGVDEALRQPLINRLAGEFPNISVLDVTRTVEQLAEIAGRLTLSLRFMAGLSLVIGLLSVVSIARREALRREREINLMRVLGAGPGRIRRLMVLEFALLGLAASWAAILLSYGCALGVAHLLFDSLWGLNVGASLLLLLAAPLLCGLTALGAVNSVLGRPPTALLD